MACLPKAWPTSRASATTTADWNAQPTTARAPRPVHRNHDTDDRPARPRRDRTNLSVRHRCHTGRPQLARRTAFHACHAAHGKGRSVTGCGVTARHRSGRPEPGSGCCPPAGLAARLASRTHLIQPRLSGHLGNLAADFTRRAGSACSHVDQRPDTGSLAATPVIGSGSAWRAGYIITLRPARHARAPRCVAVRHVPSRIHVCLLYAHSSPSAVNSALPAVALRAARLINHASEITQAASSGRIRCPAIRPST
jgi:hypothetical protein